MFSKNLKVRLLMVLIPVFFLLAGCKKTELEVIKDAYEVDFEEAYQLVSQVESKSRSAELYRENFRYTIKYAIPMAEQILVKYRKTPMAERESFKSLSQAIANFITANHYWNTQKGIYLVQRRLISGREWLEKADYSFLDETGRSDVRERKEQEKAFAKEQQQKQQQNSGGH